MSILIFAILIVIVAALLVWACDYIPMPYPLGMIVRVVVIIVAALVILQKMGVV